MLADMQEDLRGCLQNYAKLSIHKMTCDDMWSFLCIEVRRRLETELRTYG